MAVHPANLPKLLHVSPARLVMSEGGSIEHPRHQPPAILPLWSRLGLCGEFLGRPALLATLQDFDIQTSIHSTLVARYEMNRRLQRPALAAAARSVFEGDDGCQCCSRYGPQPTLTSSFSPLPLSNHAHFGNSCSHGARGRQRGERSMDRSWWSVERLGW